MVCQKIKTIIENGKSLISKKTPSIKHLLTIDSLKSKISNVKNIEMKDKKSISIVFVDDEGYDIEPIVSLGYTDCHKMLEYKELRDFEKYDIIFCDINGIAVNLDPENQGAELAKQIKETYPEKMVVIFTSKSQKLNIIKYRDYVDEMIEKNSHPSDIVELINEYLSRKYNPIAYWENTKKQLIKNNISSKEISLIEHYYVKSIINKNNYTHEILKNVSNEQRKSLENIVTCIEEIVLEYISNQV